MTSRLAPPRPHEYLPDRNRAALPDIQNRNLFLRGSEATQHTTLSVADEQTFQTTEPLRIRSVQVGALTSGTVDIQVQVDGRPIFGTPVTSGEVGEPTDIYVVPAGTVITTVIDAVSAPVGTANVVIETEPYQLVPKHEAMVLRGKDRLFPSRRFAAQLANDFATNITRTVQERRSAGVGSGEKNAEGGAAPKDPPPSVEIPRGPAPGNDPPHPRGGGGGRGRRRGR